MQQLFLFGGFIFSLCFHGVVTACTRDEISDCIRPDDGGRTQQHAYPPVDRTEFNKYCQHAARTQSCLEKIDCEQGGNYYQQWQIKIGMTEATEYLCSGDAREVFLNHGECGLRAGFSPEALRCLNISVTKLQTSRDKFCSAYNRMYKCQYEVLKTKCNADAARVYVTYFQKTAARMLLSMRCTLGAVGAGGGRITSSVTSSVMLLILSSILAYR